MVGTPGLRPTPEFEPDGQPAREPGPWHRRYWSFTDRPYTGCGCFYLIAILVVIALILSLFIDALRLYS